MNLSKTSGLFRRFSLTICIILSLSIISGCSSDDDTASLTEYQLSDVYGWTYRAVFTSSSGSTLKPQITIFNDERLDWNMSANGVGNMQYFYTAEKTGQNAWNSWWYKSLADKTENDKSKADMVVKIGIQSQELLKVLATTSNTGAGSSMSGTVLSMNRTSAEKNTTPTEIEDDSDIQDISVDIPEDAVFADWIEDQTSFKGAFSFLCAGTASEGKAYKSSETACDTIVKITKSSENKVTVTTHKVYNDFVMELKLDSWEIKDVNVKKSGDTYYFYLDENADADVYTAVSSGYRYTENKSEEFTIHGKALAGFYKDGVLTLRNEYAPGSMPLNIVDIFTGTKE